MPIILGANSLAGGGYEVDNSLRFNPSSSDYLSKTFGSAGDRDTWTFSCWVKKSKNGSEQRLLTTSDNSTFDDNIRFNSGDTFTVICNNATVLTTNRLFRDNSAFYHIIVVWNSGNATSGDRCRLYVNGTRETSFSTASYPSQNQDSFINNNTAHYIGVTNVTANSHHFNGYMSEINFIDGQALDPTSFGEFDEDTGIWKPIRYTGTYGTNGFFLEFKDSSALGDDTSGNSNDWTVNNLTSIDQTTDTPTNNFCTLNSLDNIASATFTEGNLQIVTGVSSDTYNTATFGMTAGKWYWEAKFLSSGALGNAEWGIVAQPSYKTTSGARLYQQSNSVSVNDYNYNVYANGSSTGITVGTYAQNDIINFAYDADNNAFYIGRNGTWLNSGVPTSGASKTGAFTPGTSGITYFPAVGDQNGSAGYSFQFNFGNPPYTVTAPSSDANGYGAFDIDVVPAGYYALNTKNLAEYG